MQFKVVACDPENKKSRIGKNTQIHCEGVLHPSLRNLLPPELLLQLSYLPPGLQVEEKFMKFSVEPRDARRNFGIRPAFVQILSENGVEMQAKCWQNLNFRVFSARF